ncbi:MAG: LysR family transcriptional regulator [Bacteroidales bacterium]|nr:LysR family transcriptional regulator [Bacteroidales bacterium]
MTLQQLEYIRAVEEYGHFGKAADACGVTQPTLSLMVKKLEEELDVRIFDREVHPVVPTSMGRKIIEKAGQVLYSANQIVEFTRSEKQLSSGPVSIAMIATVAPVLIPGMFTFLGKKYPDILPQVQEMLTSTIIQKLKKAEVDMGIMVSPVNDPDLMEIPLYHERFLAYVSPDYRELYDCEEIQAYELLDHPIWIIKDGLRRFDKSMLAEGERFSYDRMYEGGRAGTLIYIVNQNGGATIVPELHRGMILLSMQKNLRPIVNPDVSRTVCLVVRKDYVHEHMLNIIIESIRQSIPADNLEDMVKNGPLVL